MKITDVGTIDKLIRGINLYLDYAAEEATTLHPDLRRREVFGKAKAEAAYKIQIALEKIIDERVKVLMGMSDWKGK
jgi:hypothetical protein